MNNIPRRRKNPRMAHKDETVIRCSLHLQHVRGFVCSIEGRQGHVCNGKSQAAHVRTHGDGGTGMKPGDDRTIPLCAAAHHEQHQIGERAFEAKYGISMAEIAAGLWDKSPAGKKYRATHTVDRGR